MRDWLRTLHDEVLARGAPVVRVVVATVRGSAPREAGACMLVTPEGERGTIGGGHLELVATRIAREMLEPAAAPARLDRFSLAASLGQCCGGIVELWFQRYGAADLADLAEALRLRDSGAPPEAIAALASRDPNAARYERFSPSLTPLWLFGAGHVGSALVHVLAPLPFHITWLDSRENRGQTPVVVAASENHNRGQTPVLHAPEPAGEVRTMPPGAWALVMTHSHDEDFAICEALLRDGRFGWAGVIGSAPKTARFRQRLLQRGFSAAQIARLTMPIGIGGIRSKEAGAIAVAVAAQLLQLRESVAAREQPSMAARES
jgi:xanthine dehydrogenase accessory factor